MDPQIGQASEIVSPGPELTTVLTKQPTHRSTNIWNGQDPGALDCRGRHKEMAKSEMFDSRVVNIIKLLGLEGLHKAPTREVDHVLISSLVERWRLETHTFHLPHGEMSITLQDVEVILGLPVKGQVITGLTVLPEGGWNSLCVELLGFGIARNDQKTLVGQRILISRLLEQIATPMPVDATEIQTHQYARCYILALLGDTIFPDKSGDRVHLMFLEFLRKLHDPQQYSWGSACLSWLYRELCRASHSGAKQIGGALLLVQYWAWARFLYLRPKDQTPPGFEFCPRPGAPLAWDWMWMANPKNRSAHMALVRYHEQLVRMRLDLVKI